jgi:hypothetical protein
MQSCPDGFIMTHSYGFFSNCSVLLEYILTYYNTHKCLPKIMDISRSWSWYKPPHRQQDTIFYDFFKRADMSLQYDHSIQFSNDDQYLPMKTLPYNDLLPFVHHFFTPTDEIQTLVKELENQYGIKDYTNLCCLFYRGNDKIQETTLPSYTIVLQRAKEYKALYPSTQFLVQSDETEFLECMLQEFPDSIVFHTHIRHIRKSNTSVDKLSMHDNYTFSRYFLAIVLIMSKCNHIICISGNISMWISFFRGHAEGMDQFKDTDWV